MSTTLQLFTEPCLNTAGVPFHLEPVDLCLRDDGATLISWKQGRCLFRYFTCPNPIARSHIKLDRWAQYLNWGKKKQKIIIESYEQVTFSSRSLAKLWGPEADSFVSDFGRSLFAKSAITDQGLPQTIDECDFPTLECVCCASFHRKLPLALRICPRTLFNKYNFFIHL